MAAGRRGVDELNARYGPGTAGSRFLWLHRERRWNPAQNCWMGWERKRGKLHELNRLLRGARDTTFDLDATQYAGLPRDVRYVLALDADTQLPHGSAERLIAKLAHPLNHPRFDPVTGRVVEGYGIVQPRVTPALAASSSTSLVQVVLSGSPGIDPYAFAVSDVYQDLCGEGSYTGKGLYDLDAFERALAGRIGENSVLSATTCSRACSRAPPLHRTSKSSNQRPIDTTSLPRASTAGRAATGSCCRGCCRGECPASAAGSCSTTCAARSYR